MNKLLRVSALGALLAAGVNGAASAAAPMSDSLGVNDLTHDDSMLAQGYAPAPVVDPTTPPPPSTSSQALNAPAANWKAGPVTLSMVGFTEFAGIWRQRDEGADVSSTFKLNYPNSALYYTGEVRESARQSRFGFLAQGPFDGLNKVEGYFEMDFLSAGVTSNSNESNSYTLRLRQAYATWAQPDNGWYILAGQSWSLATLYKSGLAPRQEDIPLTIDAQYVPGFNWTRNAQIRFVAYGPFAAFGLSLENPENISASSTALTSPGGTGSVTGSTGTSPNNTTTAYGTEIAPDIIGKLALEPGWGHFEVYSLTRWFHDRGFAGSSTTASNHTRVGQSIGGGFILPLIPKVLDVQASGIWGRGNARYGSGQLPDAIVSASDGSLTAMREYQALAGIILHPSKRVDLYAYGGYEREPNGAISAPASNASCNVPSAGGTTLPSACTTALIKQATGGFWWKFYKGPLGYLMTGVQVSATSNKTFRAVDNTYGKANDLMAFYSLRYYPFQ